MYLPLPFFWSLFSMQGSRWTLTATQTNGWCGPVKVRPDQMQIMNPIMILAFLPIFQYGVYPLIEKCGIRLGSFFLVIKDFSKCSIYIIYHVDLEKRGGCCVVARERHESHMSQQAELLAKAKQLKIFPFIKILTVHLFNFIQPYQNFSFRIKLGSSSLNRN